ncbi:MAG: DMT family transporter [Bacteroidetes bacterium]|nr:DMT family transporter [Bacteroidota bacterium]
MISGKLKADLILLLAAAIWGFAFVAQRVGMDYVGPFTYNGVRFSLGVLVLLPLLYNRLHKGKQLVFCISPLDRRKILMGSLFTGLILFGGVALQQLGLQKTTAGKAGFLTELYVVFVPFIGLFFGQRSNWYIWAGVLLSMVGLYFLCITKGFSLGSGDSLVLMCSFVFTFHVLFIGWLSPRMDSILLAVIQFSITAVLNLFVAFSIETVSLAKVIEAWLPISYGGILSVGVAYTLQIIAQKTAHPAYVSIILGLEAVFAVIGGMMLLGETMSMRMLGGCLLMLGGTALVQVKGKSTDIYIKIKNE